MAGCGLLPSPAGQHATKQVAPKSHRNKGPTPKSHIAPASEHKSFLTLGLGSNTSQILAAQWLDFPLNHNKQKCTNVSQQQPSVGFACENLGSRHVLEARVSFLADHFTDTIRSKRGFPKEKREKHKHKTKEKEEHTDTPSPKRESRWVSFGFPLIQPSKTVSQTS